MRVPNPSIPFLLLACEALVVGPASAMPVVDAGSLRGKVMCGYQGWFRCPGDAAKLGWVHWSRDPRRIAPDTLTFEMWPDMAEYSARERYPAPGFSDERGRQATLFSSDNPATVLRHFRWMRDYDIDGAWLQHFLVDLPGGPISASYASRMRVLGHVRQAARQTGRVWALAYDVAGMQLDRIYDVLAADWKRMVDGKVVADPRYLREGGKPVVLIWGLYRNDPHDPMTPELANRLVELLRAPGPYAAYVVGGGDWNWRAAPDPAWQAACRRFDAYAPWNVGNYSIDAEKAQHASTHTWAGDLKECQSKGMLWLPIVYPGFSWDNLTRKPPGSSLIARRGGRFLWEQFVTLARMKVDSVYLAMFDEVDEGTAIFKVTSSPPTQAHFVDYEGLPSDWYLRLVQEGVRMLRGQRPISEELPIKPPPAGKR